VRVLREERDDGGTTVKKDDGGTAVKRDDWWERLRVCVDGQLWDQKLEMAGLGLFRG